MQRKGIRRKLYLLTCDKGWLNQKALRIWQSLEEVKKLLVSPRCGK